MRRQGDHYGVTVMVVAEIAPISIQTSVINTEIATEISQKEAHLLPRSPFNYTPGKDDD